VNALNFDLSPEEVHALIEWHDGESEIANSWDAHHIEDARRHKKRADQLYFMLTGAKRKQSKPAEEEPEMNQLDKAYRRFYWALAAFCCALSFFVGEHIYFAFFCKR
jgi:hypothetical protein